MREITIRPFSFFFFKFNGNQGLCLAQLNIVFIVQKQVWIVS